MKARTRGRPQLLQAAQPHHQRRCAGHTGLQVMLRAHRAVSRVDGLAQAGRVLSGGAAHLQARETSSVMLLALTDSEMVTVRCDLGSASTCERRAGDWQLSAAMSAAPRESSVPGCTCSQVLAVAVDEVGAQNFRWCCSPGPCASGEPLRSSSRRERRDELWRAASSDAREVCCVSATKTA